MVIISDNRRYIGIDFRGKYGYSANFGRAKFSYNKFGLNNIFAGVYQLRYTKKGKKISLSKHSKPTNPNTIDQFFTRFRFCYAVRIWHLSSPQYQAEYNTRAKKFKMTGYNLHIRDTLNWLYGN